MPRFQRRDLFTGRDLRITHWCCDGRDAPRPRAEEADRASLIVTLSGRWAVRHAGGRMVACPWHALYHRAGDEYEVRHPDGCDATLAFAGPLIDGLCSDGPRRREVPVASYLALRRLATELRAGAALDAVAIEERVLTAITPAAPAPARRDHAIAEAITHAIALDLHRRPGLADLAAAAGVSVAHACRAFRRATGTTIHAHLHEARLRHALAMVVDTARPLAEVALAAGFANQGHLGNAFRARFGVSPGRARRVPDVL